MVIYEPTRDGSKYEAKPTKKNKTKSSSKPSLTEYCSIEVIKDVHVYGTLGVPLESKDVYDIIPADYGLQSFERIKSTELKSQVPPPVPPKPFSKSKAIDNPTNELKQQDIAPELPPRSRTDNMSEEVYISLDETMMADLQNRSCTNTRTIKEVGNALKKMGLQKYVNPFRDAKIDGVILSAFDEQILCDEFKMKRFEAIKVLSFAKTGHIPKWSEM